MPARASGSSERAAVIAVSMLVKQRMPSASAAARIDSASRTGPGSGDGVLTTSRTSLVRIVSRMVGSRPSSSATRATSGHCMA
jgi:hypothetical protein